MKELPGIDYAVIGWLDTVRSEVARAKEALGNARVVADVAHARRQTGDEAARSAKAELDAVKLRAKSANARFKAAQSSADQAHDSATKSETAATEARKMEWWFTTQTRHPETARFHRGVAQDHEQQFTEFELFAQRSEAEAAAAKNDYEDARKASKSLRERAAKTRTEYRNARAAASAAKASRRAASAAATAATHILKETIAAIDDPESARARGIDPDLLWTALAAFQSAEFEAAQAAAARHEAFRALHDASLERGTPKAE